MASLNITVKGGRALRKKLERLSSKDAKKVMRKGMRAGAKIINTQVKADAPKDTGALRKATKVRSLPRSRTTFGVKVQMGAGAFVGDTFYGGFLEYGAPGRGLEPLEFMRKATDKTKKKAGEVATQAMKDAITDLAKK